MAGSSTKKAVALHYPKNAESPFIAAKAKGFLAERMLQIAEQKKIPVVENSNLANILTVNEIGCAVPEETWEALARIFAFVVKIGERKEYTDVTQN